MATTQPVVKFTYEDYLTTPADERYELLDGDLIMVPAPNLKHQHVLGNLHYHLRQFITEHGTGRLFLAPCDVFLSDSNVVQPDLLFVSREREHLLSDGEKVRGAPISWSKSCLHRPPTRTGAPSANSTADTGWRSTGWSTPSPKPSRSIANAGAYCHPPTPSAGDRRYARRSSPALNSA